MVHGDLIYRRDKLDRALPLPNPKHGRYGIEISAKNQA